jgi:pimeloyl-ACP methyl ester carboxylesterase
MQRNRNVLSFTNREQLQLSYFHSEGEIPVLLIPGFGCNHSCYEFMTDYFSCRYGLIIPDNRGMGPYQNVTSDYSIENLADDCIDLMDLLGHDKFHVVGTSMGGFVAQVLMTKYRERILSTSLLCTTSNHDHFIPIKIYSEEELRAFDQFPAEQGMKVSTENIVHSSLINDHHDQFLKIVESRVKSKVNIEQLLWQRQAVANFFSDQDQKINFELNQAPCLFLSGANDSFVHPDNVYKFKDVLSSGETKLVSETDHLFFMEKPEQVVSILEEFIGRV